MFLNGFYQFHLLWSYCRVSPRILNFNLEQSWWVNIWTRSYETESTFFITQPSTVQYLHLDHSTQHTVESHSSSSLWYYLGIYIGLSIAIVVIGTIRYFITFCASIRASRILFEKLSYTILRTPLRWLDTVPVGRVLNRFTSDFNILDSRIAHNLGFAFYMVLELLGITIAGFLVSYFMIIFATALMSVALYIALRYLYGAREVKRLESNSKSPIFEQFGSALAGVGTIRAFDKADEYIDRYVLVLFKTYLLSLACGLLLTYSTLPLIRLTE